MSDLGQADDINLVLAIAGGYEPALAEVYRRHGAAVRALARRVVGSLEAADDIAQDVFLRLWESPERFDAARGSLRNFLLAAGRSRALDQVRSQAARSAREERTAVCPPGAWLDVEGEVWGLQQDAWIRRAVEALPERTRRPIELAYFGGHSYQEVAVLLGEAEGTVKGRIRAGLSHLRRALAHEAAWL